MLKIKFKKGHNFVKIILLGFVFILILLLLASVIAINDKRLCLNYDHNIGDVKNEIVEYLGKPKTIETIASITDLVRNNDNTTKNPIHSPSILQDIWNFSGEICNFVVRIYKFGDDGFVYFSKFFEYIGQKPGRNETQYEDINVTDPRNSSENSKKKGAYAFGQVL